MQQYKTQYGTIFAVREYKGHPAIMLRAEHKPDDWSLSSMIEPFTPGAWTAEELQAQLDNWAAVKGWRAVEDPAGSETREIVDDEEEEIRATDSCKCRTCKCESCFAHGCAKECPANAEESCLTIGCPEYVGENEPCKTETPAPTGDAAATTDASAVPMPSTVAETSTTSESGEDASNSPGSPSAPADMSPRDTKTESNAPATPTTAMAASGNGLLPAFDFGADADTNAGLINDAQIFMAGSMARVMAAKRAHDRTANRYRGSWGKWCDFVGISRDTGDNMVRVAEQFGNIQVDGKPLIDLQPLKLLYATSKPSTPPEIRQQVENLDITSYKQYQDLLARYNAERAAREKAEQEREESRKIANTIANQRDEERRRASEAEKQRDGARNALQAAKLRGDKLKAENDALKAHPIEAQVVDEEEINRRAQARADELTAPLREELETLRNRHPADPEEAEQAIRDAYDSAIYTSRTIENAWHSLRPLLSCMDSERRVMAVRQLEKILTKTQEELRKCL